jgi:pimeloyl-ACP methyl ester carboxylesterase/predicted glycosyltransferase
MRAREPDVTGVIDSDGVKVGYEVWNCQSGRPDPATIVLLPAWLVADRRLWKLQAPYLSRFFRVITLDPRGNGASDRPADSEAYADVLHARDAIAVLDLLSIDRAIMVGLSLGGWRALVAAMEFPDRVAGVVAAGSAVPLRASRERPDDEPNPFEVEHADYHGWNKYNAHYWRRDYAEFLRFFFDQAAPEPHSTKVIEDAIDWGLDTDAETLILGEYATPYVPDTATLEAALGRITCPVLVIHGDRDNIIPVTHGRRVAELTGAEYIEMAGAGHMLNGRHPVAFNQWTRDFAATLTNTPTTTVWAAAAESPRTWTRPLDRPRRVLYLSSPIGLGHARRDLAIVEELRRRKPGVQVDWLAQHPVTAVLAARGERVHPASNWLASESGHWESESEDHDLHAFQAVRRMDEVLVNNFMVFADLVADEPYDLWVGDEAWDVDYFLHENPELKRTAYAWFTDFVGWVPMPDGGTPEAALTADYNAEMVEQIARFPRLRDRALFVGEPEDVLTAPLGPGLPAIDDWTRANFGFTGYITGFDPAEVADRAALRAEFGWRDDERIVLVTAGGTRVGEPFLRKVIAALPEARKRVDGLRMVVVTGPRIDLSALGTAPDLDVETYVPDLHRRLAACDMAVVQGGLTTTMELTATGRPFIYVPIGHHFEQNFHVAHRLDRHRAGRRMDYSDLTPEVLADAIAEEITRTPDYRKVATDGAARAADQLAELF